MIRTGSQKDGQVIFPENATAFEVVATVKHLNGSYLPAAKMFLQVIDTSKLSEEEVGYIKQAIEMIALSIKVEEAAVQYLFKNQNK